jgi:asparagine synthase (glutamine-hydrolysing)
VAAARPEDRYARLMEVFPLDLRAELWEPGFAEAAPVSLEPKASGTAGLQQLDVETYLPGDLLLKADIASMAHSLELRSPLLDHEVLELGISLPDSLRGRRGKEALRQAFAPDLPPEVAGRRKTGFGVPIARWFRGELRELAGDLLLDETARRRGQLRPRAVDRLLREHAEGRADHAHRLWCLLMLELWQRTYVEAEAPALVAA